ncbi:MAG: 6-phosphogluconolactonase [Verrucomicrobia bacterium]|nr:6-phosphogluconolactonase [Verrucomicrobiota bacterium]
MQIETLPTADDVAARAAQIIARDARSAVGARGLFVMAVSGGRTPWQMLRALANEDVPWAKVHVVQVDERIAPAGDPDRNLTHLRESLLSHAPIPQEQIHAMPVEMGDLGRSICGQLAVIDLAHLGLGPDGHTASLIPGDPVCEVHNAEVALTGVYQNRRRMTLTYPILNRSRHILWVVTGGEKAPMLPRLLAGDPTIPAGPIAQQRATLLADAPAAAELK